MIPSASTGLPSAATPIAWKNILFRPFRRSTQIALLGEREGCGTRACTGAGIRHGRTQPYHPWTNGRAEAFIGTIQRECIYSDARFSADAERTLAIALYVSYCNAERPHTAL